MSDMSIEPAEQESDADSRGLLGAVRRALGFQLSIAELIGIALIIGVPYLIVGAFWSTGHSTHLQDTQGADLVISFVGSMVFWPALLFSDVCMI